MASSMIAVTAPTHFTDPSGYALSTVPKPTVSEATDVIIRVHAASINPVDVKAAAGAFKMALSEHFPLAIGYDCAGTVTDVGTAVKEFKVGDAVWSRLPEVGKGSWAEYVKCPEHYVARKPELLSFAEAASLPLSALTALQALQKYDGSLAGKTVFIPAGLGGVGAFACQIAKNVFDVGKVITTVSTAKVAKVPVLLSEDTVDEVIDYTQSDPMKVIPRGSVDFILDTTGDSMTFLSLLKPSTGLIVSVATMPSGTQLQDASFFKRPGNPKLPWFARMYLDGADSIRKLRARRWGVNYTYMFVASDAKELNSLATLVDGKKVRPVIGSRTRLRDIQKVKEVCLQVFQGKGGIGKAVFEVVDD